MQWRNLFAVADFSLQCTDDDNRSYRNVCNMSFVSFSLAVIFIIVAEFYCNYSVGWFGSL